MIIEPQIDSFSTLYDAGKPQVVWTKLVADLETPVSAMLKLADGRANSFLFESVEGGNVRGRYSLIGLKPDLIWRCRGEKAEINRQARFQPDDFVAVDKPALESLRDLIAESRIDLPRGLPPMASGLFGISAMTWSGKWRSCPTCHPIACPCRTASSCGRPSSPSSTMSRT